MSNSTFTTELETPTEEPAQPAGELLVQALNNLEKTATELEEFKGCIALAETDENAALENDTISEDEVVSRVKEAQALKAVHMARCRRAERSIPVLTTELEAACAGAERQLLERIAEESAKRSDVIKQRVLDVLDIEGYPDVLIRVELNTCVQHSRAIRTIERLHPAGYFEPGNAEHASGRAHTILDNLGSLAAEVAKGI
jgi:hypothetical protein